MFILGQISFPTSPPGSVEEAEKRLLDLLQLAAETPLRKPSEYASAAELTFLETVNRMHVHFRMSLQLAYQQMMGSEPPEALVWGPSTVGADAFGEPATCRFL